MRLLYSIYATYSTGFNLVFKILPAFLAAMFGVWEISLIYTAYFGAKILIIPAGLTSDRMGTIKTIRLSFSLMTLAIVFFWWRLACPASQDGLCLRLWPV